MKVIKPGPDRVVPRGVVGGAEISQATSGAHNVSVCAQANASDRATVTLLNNGLPAFTPSAILLQFIQSVLLAAARWDPNT